jgi:hypothetical protein
MELAHTVNLTLSLHPPAGGVRLSGGRDRCLQPARHRLGDGRSSARQLGHRRPQDGPQRAPASLGQPHSSLRSRRAVCLWRLHQAVGSARHHHQHEPGRQSLRQRQGRELHEDAQGRGRSTAGCTATSRRPSNASAPSSRTSTTSSACIPHWATDRRPSSKPGIEPLWGRTGAALRDLTASRRARPRSPLDLKLSRLGQ